MLHLLWTKSTDNYKEFWRWRINPKPSNSKSRDFMTFSGRFKRPTRWIWHKGLGLKDMNLLNYCLKAILYSYFHYYCLFSLFTPARFAISLGVVNMRVNKYILTHGAEASLRSCQLCSHSRTSQRFMEPEGSLPPSQEPSTGPYPQPDWSNPHHLILTL
jgi:hypothetical protein